jgi:hypothetical protein
VVWSVTPALHTPLMSVTNAISSVIVVGALLAVGVGMISSGSGLGARLRLRRADLRLVNIFGGFLVTQRMLAMYKKKTSERRAPRGDEGKWGPEMNANLAAVPLSRGRRAVHPGAARAVQPRLSRQGNFFGMIGMAIAIAPRSQSHPPADGVGLGAGHPRHRHRRRHRRGDRAPGADDLDAELVAAFHSLVGMAAVLVAAGAFYAPEAFGIGTPGDIHAQSLVEMSLGVAIGAITFTGSVIAFLKLTAHERRADHPAGRHIINIALALALVFFIVGLVMSGSALDFWLITIIALVLGVLMIIPIGGADMPVVSRC